MQLNGRKYNAISGVNICAVTSAFPSGGRWLNNIDLHTLRFGSDWAQVFKEKNLDPNYIENELGYVKRYWSGEAGIAGGINALDLMEAAALKALQKSALKPQDIDLCIAVTVTSPRHINSMGTMLAGKLGLSCPAFEIKAGCASLIYAMLLGAQHISGGARNVLIISGETPSKVTDKTTNLIYAVGDAGGAIIISAGSAEQGLITGFLGADGQYAGTMGSSGVLPPTHEDIDAGKYFMTVGNESDALIERAWSGIPEILFRQAELSNEQIEMLVPHQVNKKRFETVLKASGVKREKAIYVLDKYANCGSAGIALALEQAMQKPEVLLGNKIMMVAVGGGVSYGGMIWQL